MTNGVEELSDEQLFSRVCQGEKELYRILFDRYKRPVASVIFRMTARTDDLEDLVADVFMTAYQKRSQYRHSGPFKSWLYRIAINTARQHMRKLQVHRKALTGLVITDGPEHCSSAMVSLEKRESEELVKGCLSKLRPKLRAVFILRDLEGLTYEEIAQVTNCPVGTVKSRLNAARKTMVRLVKKSLNFTEE